MSEIFDDGYDPYTTEPDWLPGLEFAFDHAHIVNKFDPEDWEATDYAFDMNFGMKVKVLKDTILTIKHSSIMWFEPQQVGSDWIIEINDIDPVEEDPGEFWYYITVPYPQAIKLEDDPPDYLGPFHDMIAYRELAIIKQEDGDIYIPDGMQEIEYLYSGRGYVLGFYYDEINHDYAKFEVENYDLYNPCSYNPENGNDCQISCFEKHFDFQTRTIDFYPIVVDSLVVEGIEPENGDEIAVFTPDSLCVGASVYQGEFPGPQSELVDERFGQMTLSYAPGHLFSDNPMTIPAFNPSGGIFNNHTNAESGKMPPAANRLGVINRTPLPADRANRSTVLAGNDVNQQDFVKDQFRF